MSERYLIVGLGNPGREYENTRHNVGFACADALVKAHNLAYDTKKKSKAKIAVGTIVGKSVLIAKPQTYMNLSGSSVQGLATFYRIPPEQILVIFDDLDLPLGTLRIRKKGGSGGHRGLTDILQRLGTQEFPRIRFGISRPPDKMDPAAFVLRRFEGDEIPLVTQTLERAVKAVETWLSEGIDAAMNRYNGTSQEQ
ncbi:MAG TPA: aminoacyl-tRNA hydrolase [Aggregatilineaceae bacterium]|nr:aminoacyl-tRNA hydrolase [Aggregatilineaceae bacterium]